VVVGSMLNCMTNSNLAVTELPVTTWRLKVWYIKRKAKHSSKK